MRFIFTLEADQQADDCDWWWREHRPANPGLFARELVEAKVLLDLAEVGMHIPTYTQ